MPNFFANPMIPRVTNPEPPGFDLIRQMLMNGSFRRNANPYGFNPGGGGSNPLFPSGGQGQFDPYTGTRVGSLTPGGPPGGGGSTWSAGGAGGGNSFMQMLQNLFQQMQGGAGQPGGGGSSATGVGNGVPIGGMNAGGGPRTIGMRPPTPQPLPGLGHEDPGQPPVGPGPGMRVAPGMMGDTAPQAPGPDLGGPSGPPGAIDSGGIERGRPPLYDGEEAEYDGRRDAGKAIHAHMAMMKSILPMLMQPRPGAPTPPPTPSGSGPMPAPMPGYDGASLPPFGAGFHPYDGMAPETAPSWTPLSDRNGGSGINVAPGNTPTTLPTSRDVPPLPRPGYDGFTRVRAPMAMPRPPMSPGAPMSVASNLNRILSGAQGANRRGNIGLARMGSTHAAFDGNTNAPRGPAPSYDGPPTVQRYGSTTGTAGTTDPNTTIVGGAPPPAVDTGGSASPYPSGAQTGGQAMYPWLMPYTGARTAGMSPYEMQGLGTMSDFVGGGMNLTGSQNYLNDLLSGKYIGDANPYMQNFEAGANTLKNQEDTLARARIGSSMAAGGNALSGARAASEQQYQNSSDASFQKMIADMQMQNLARERALQQGGVGLQGNLSGEFMGGLNQLMGAGAVPRNISQSDLNSQYSDWLRQIGTMNSNDQFQQNLAMQMLHTSPGAYQPGYGTSAAEGIAALLAGSGGGSAIGNLLKQLLGGGSGGGSKPGGGASGGGGGTPGHDSSGNAPGDPNYDPTTDPGSPSYIPTNQGDMNMQYPYGIDPTSNMPYTDSSYGAGSGYDIFGGQYPPGGGTTDYFGGDPGYGGDGYTGGYDYTGP